MADHDFGTFLDALTGPAGQMLSKVWTTGKDNRLVVILCRSNHVGGSAGELVYDPNQDPGGVIGVSLGVNLAHQVDPRPHDEGWDLHPDTFPADPHYSVWLTAAHEIGHACGLGEEYADTADPPTAARIADTLKRPNNQARGTLLNAAGELRSENIRWAQWPRIAKAAALLGPPLPQAGGRFLLACAGKATPPFAIGDIVRLRTRPLALSKGPSGRLEVESIAADGLSLLVVPLPAVVLDPAAFPGDSIVMMPVRAHDPNAAAKQYGDDIGMVTDDVLLRINFSNNPLNARPMAGEAAAPNDPANRPCPNVELPVPTPATNFPGGAKGTPKPPLFSSWIIGLYENANRHRCGIYRPTGVCIMNTQARVSAGTVYQYEYCQVCRYAIVDQLDPSGHAGVEQDYRDRYL